MKFQLGLTHCSSVYDAASLQYQGADRNHSLEIQEMNIQSVHSVCAVINTMAPFLSFMKEDLSNCPMQFSFN